MSNRFCTATFVMEEGVFEQAAMLAMMPVDTYRQGIMYGSAVVAGLGGGMRSTDSHPSSL